MNCPPISPIDHHQPNGTSHSSTRISIVIADGSELYREMLKKVIETFPDLEVIGAASNGCQALEMIAARYPQLVLLDLQLPYLSGLQSLALIREYHPATRVIIMTSDESNDVYTTCLAQGAHGVFSKRRLHQELRQRITEVFCNSPLRYLSASQRTQDYECSKGMLAGNV